jgi:hypothetical protein
MARPFNLALDLARPDIPPGRAVLCAASGARRLYGHPTGIRRAARHQVRGPICPRKKGHAGVIQPAFVQRSDATAAGCVGGCCLRSRNCSGIAESHGWITSSATPCWLWLRLAECLKVLQVKAQKQSGGLFKAQSFHDRTKPQNLWFIEDGPGGATTALRPTDCR